MDNALIVPDQFHKTALAFPAGVKAWIAKIETPQEAAEGLAKAQAVADFAKRINATAEEVNHVQYGKLLLAAKVGELAEDNRGRPKKGEKKHSPTVNIFSAKTLVDYRKLNRHQSEAQKIDAYFQAVCEADHQSEITIAGFLNYVGSGGVIATRHGGGVIDWYTPKEHIERVREVLGTIDLDPATSETAQQTVQAKVYYDKDDDGLSRPWEGKVFLNPPFKMPLVAQFVSKLCEEYEADRVSEAILLTNNNTDTEWWQMAISAAAAVCFTNGRISFYNEAGAWSSPTNGQTFFYLGKTPERFCDVFDSVGAILQHVR